MVRLVIWDAVVLIMTSVKWLEKKHAVIWVKVNDNINHHGMIFLILSSSNTDKNILSQTGL